MLAPLIVMLCVLVVSCVRRGRFGEGDPGAEHEREPRGIRREHEADGHERACHEQWHEPKSQAMEMCAFHASAKYTDMRAAVLLDFGRCVRAAVYAPFEAP